MDGHSVVVSMYVCEYLKRTVSASGRIWGSSSCDV